MVTLAAMERAFTIPPTARLHVAMLFLIAAATAVLRLRPEWVLQLGLHCGMQQILGLKCPFCGMTRDFIAMLHGRRPELNLASPAMAAVVYGVYPVAVAIAWQRGRFDWFYRPVVYRVLGVCLAGMFLLNNFA